MAKIIGVVHNLPIYLWNQPVSPSIFGKWEKTFNSLLFLLNPMKLQWLQIQSKKTIMQSSTLSLPCGVQLINFFKKISLDLTEKITNWSYFLIFQT